MHQRLAALVMVLALMRWPIFRVDLLLVVAVSTSGCADVELITVNGSGEPTDEPGRLMKVVQTPSACSSPRRRNAACTFTTCPTRQPPSTFCTRANRGLAST